MDLIKLGVSVDFQGQKAIDGLDTVTRKFNDVDDKVSKTTLALEKRFQSLMNRFSKVSEVQKTITAFKELEIIVRKLANLEVDGKKLVGGADLAKLISYIKSLRKASMEASEALDFSKVSANFKTRTSQAIISDISNLKKAFAELTTVMKGQGNTGELKDFTREYLANVKNLYSELRSVGERNKDSLTGPITAAEKKLNEFIATSKRLYSELGNTSSQSKTQSMGTLGLTSTSELKAQLKGYTDAYREIKRLEKAGVVSKKELSDAFNKLKEKVREVVAAYKAQRGEEAASISSARKLQQAEKDLAEAAKQGAKEARLLEQAQKRLNSSHASGSKSALQHARDLNSVVFTIRNLYYALVGYGIGSMIRSIFEAGADYQQLKLSFEGIAGSAQGASKELAWLRDTSEKLSLNFYSLADGYKSISAAAMGTALEGQEVHKIYQALITAGSALGLSNDKIKGSLYAVEQMISKGTISMEELRRQLGNQLPGAFQIAAQAMGATTTELMRMVKEGELATEEFIPKFARALEDRFAGTAEKAVGLAVRAIDRFQMAWMDLKIAMSENGFLDAAVNFINELTTQFQSPDFIEAVGRFGEEIGKTITALASGITAATDFANTVISIYNSLPPIIRELGLIGAIMLGPKGIAIAGVIAAVAYKATNSYEVMSYSIEYGNTLLDKQREALSGLSVGSKEYEEAQKGVAALEQNIQDRWEKKVGLIRTNEELLKEEQELIKKQMAAKYDQLNLMGQESATGKALQKDIAQLASNYNDLGDMMLAAANPDMGKTISHNIEESLDPIGKLSDAIDRSKDSALANAAAQRKMDNLLKDIPKTAKDSAQKIEELNAKYAKHLESLLSIANNEELSLETRTRAQADYQQVLENQKNEIDKITKADELAANAALAAAAAAEKKSDAYDHYNDTIKAAVDATLADISGNDFAKTLANIDKEMTNMLYNAEQKAKSAGESVEGLVDQIKQLRELKVEAALSDTYQEVFGTKPGGGEEKSILAMYDELYKVAKKNGSDTIQLENWKKTEILKIQDKIVEAKIKYGELSFEDTEDLVNKEIVKYEEGGSKEREAAQKVLEYLLENSAAIYATRASMWDGIAAKAQAAGNAEVAAFSQAKAEAERQNSLEEKTKTGSSSEAFKAQLALEYDLYKSADTKKRELAVETASFIKSATDDMVSGISGSFGDMIRGFADGSASLEDLWQNMLSRMLDMVASFVEQMIAEFLKAQVIGPMMESFIGGGIDNLTGSFGSGSNSATNIATSIGGDALDSYLGSAIESSMGSFFSSAGSEATIAIAETATTTLDTEIAGMIGASLDAAIPAATGVGASLMSGLATAGIGAVIGLGLTALTGGFDTKKTETQTGTGYKLGVVDGMMYGSGSEYYTVEEKSMFGENTSHEIRTVSLDPEAIQSIEDAYQTNVEALKEAGTLFDFDTDLSNWDFPEFDVTDEQLEDYFKNLGNAMAYFKLDSEGLLPVVTDLQKDSETLLETLNRLQSAYVKANETTFYYGYSLETLAGVTQETLDAMRSSAEETASTLEPYDTAMSNAMSQAASMMEGIEGASVNASVSMDTITSATQNIASETDFAAQGMSESWSDAYGTFDTATEAVDSLSTTLDTTTEALESVGVVLDVTDEQLKTFALADYASKLIEAVGGDEEWDAAWERISNRTKESWELLDSAVIYYTANASNAIENLEGIIGDSGITVENFWDKFEEALNSYMDPEAFAYWNQAAKYADSLAEVNDQLEENRRTWQKWSESLEQRKLAAEGREDEADLLDLLTSHEWELVEAREAGASAAQLAYLAEVQEIELKKLAADKEEERLEALASANKRYYDAVEDETSLFAMEQANNVKELYDTTWKYGQEVADALEAAMKAEKYAYVSAKNAELQATKEAFEQDMRYRNLVLEGKEEEAEAAQILVEQAKELQEAYDNGLSQSEITELQNVQLREMAKYWSDIQDSLDDAADSADSLADRLQDALDDALEAAIDQVDYMLDGANAAKDAADELRDRWYAVADTVQGLLEDLLLGDSSNLTADQKTTTAKSWYEETYAKAMSGDIDAAESVADYAQAYLEAAKSSTTDPFEYSKTFGRVTSQLASLEVLGDLEGARQDTLSQLLEIQISLLELQKELLEEGGTQTELLAQNATAIGIVGELIGSQTTTTVDVAGTSLTEAQALRSRVGAGVGYQMATYNLLQSGITFDDEIWNAMQSDSQTGLGYLSGINGHTASLISVTGDVVGAVNDLAEQLQAETQLSALQSQYQALQQQAISSIQNSTQGTMVQGIANSGAGYQMANNIFQNAYGINWWNSASASERSSWLDWWQQSYGEGSGYVDWSWVLNQFNSSNRLDSNTNALYDAYLEAYQDYLDLREEYGFANGGIMTSRGPINLYSSGGIANTPQVAIYGEGSIPEAYVPLPDGHTIPVTLSGEFSSEGLQAEMREMRKDMNDRLYLLRKDTQKLADKISRWDDEGLPKERTTQ